MKKNPYERIKHGFDRFPTSPPIATTDRVGGFLLEENGDFVLDKLGHLKLANSGAGGGGGSSSDSGRVGDIVFTFNPSIKLGGYWLESAGQSMSKQEYPELFEVIGYKYGGQGDNFLLPNFKQNQWFVRSYSSNNPIGSTQIDAIRNITGKVALLGTGGSLLWGGAKSGVFDFEKYDNFSKYSVPSTSSQYKGLVQNITFDASKSVTTASENRPVNIAMRVLIKVK